MSKVTVEYNYGNLEISYDKEFPIMIDRVDSEDVFELTVEEAEKVIVELTKMVRDIRVMKIDKVKDYIIKEFEK